MNDRNFSWYNDRMDNDASKSLIYKCPNASLLPLDANYSNVPCIYSLCYICYCVPSKTNLEEGNFSDLQGFLTKLI